MSGSFAMRSTFGALLLAFAASIGCSAATKTPIPAPAHDAPLPKPRKADCSVCGRVLLGNAVGV